MSEQEKNRKKIQFDHLTVKVTNLRFSYGKTKILRKVSMNIPTGSIYGLLGPSGCGKTTLLKCITGTLRFKSGFLSVFGKRPGSPGSLVPGPGVGYMPQDTALYSNLSVKDTLVYFAQLYYMKKDVREEKIEHLMKVMDLPDPKRKVAYLSGGQMRRLSLAAALISSPPLLILDEPTVGVDPLLRDVYAMHSFENVLLFHRNAIAFNRIWKYLVNMSEKEAITMLVTTHYIDEASYCDIVGFIRLGHMLVEDEPVNLLRFYDKQNLEDVFLLICKEQVNFSQTLDVDDMDAGSDKPLKSNLDVIKANMDIPQKLKPNSVLFTNLWFAWLLSLKNVIDIVKAPISFLMDSVFPVLGLILSCLFVGNDPSNLNLAFYAPQNNFLEQLFYNKTAKASFNLKRSSTTEHAIQLVRDSSAWAALIFPNNYTENMHLRRDSTVDERVINDSTIEYHGDYSVLPIYKYTWKRLKNISIQVAEEAFNSKLLVAPMVDVVPHVGDFETSFRDFFAAGMVIGTLFLSSAAYVSLAMVGEKKEGILERCYVLGVKNRHIYFSQVLPHFLFSFIQMFVFLMFLYFMFKVARGNVFLAAAIMMSTSFMGMSFGFVVASLCHEEQEVILMVIGSFYPMLLLSGTVWPKQGMPSMLQSISELLPQTLPTISLRCVMSKDWGITIPDVWLGFVATYGWSTIFILIATFIVILKET